MESGYITIAIPKGRLQNKITKHFANCDITIKEESRRLEYTDEKNKLRFLFVKNADVPVYVNFGAATIGIAGNDVIYESGFEFVKLMMLPFGSTRICVAGYDKDKDKYLFPEKNSGFINEIKIATKFTKFTRDYFYTKNMPVKIIKLTGSVELGPILGLSDFIVDLVETGTTLKENNLAVIDQIGETRVEMFANPSLYRLNYAKIDKIIERIKNIQ